MRGGTYEHENDGGSGLDGLALDFAWCRRNTDVALGARQALSFSDVGVESSIIALLGNGLDFSPDSLILRTKEERQDLVELHTVSAHLQSCHSTYSSDRNTNTTKGSEPEVISDLVNIVTLREQLLHKLETT